MASRLTLGNINIDVVFKDIKNVHLSVYPPNGRVRIAAPVRMNLDTLRVFAISKLAWIKQQRKKIRGQERESPREYLDRESHYVWGKRYLLRVIEEEAAPHLQITPRKMILRVRPGTDTAAREAIVAQWYRQQLKVVIPDLIAKWEKKLRVKVNGFFIQRMKTKWGSCNPTAGTIRINSELAKKPRECLEYIVVHELVHLRESRHNDRFFALLEKHMPMWQRHRDELNRGVLAHEEWTY